MENCRRTAGGNCGQTMRKRGASAKPLESRVHVDLLATVSTRADRATPGVRSPGVSVFCDDLSSGPDAAVLCVHSRPAVVTGDP